MRAMMRVNGPGVVRDGRGAGRMSARSALIVMGVVLALLTALTAPLATAQEAAPQAAAASASAATAAESGTGEDGSYDFTAWAALSKRAQEVIDTGAASVDALEALRATLVAERDRLQAFRDKQEAKAGAIRAQLDALGPPPGEGEPPEPADVAQLRERLTAELQAVEGPLRQADAALAEAAKLLEALDALIRARQRQTFLSRGPVPVDPVLWLEAGRRLQDFAGGLGRELTQDLFGPARTIDWGARLAGLVLSWVAALVLLLRAAPWVERFLPRADNPRSLAGILRDLATVLLDLVLPLGGVWFLRLGVDLANFSGIHLLLLRNAILPVGAVLVGGVWLVRRLLAGDGFLAADLEPQELARMRRIALGLVVVGGLHFLIVRLAVSPILDEDTAVILDFPLIVLAGLFLFRLGRFLVAIRPRPAGVEEAEEIEEGDEGAQPPVRYILFRLLGNLAMAVGLAAPALALFGWHNAASGILYPAIETLAVLGGVIVLQRFVTDLYVLILRLGGAAEAEAGKLVAALVSLSLYLAAVPALALVWGARPTDLLEIWQRLSEGFTVGQTRITPADFFTFLFVFLIGYTLTRLFQGVLRNSVLPNTRLDQGAQSAIITGTGYLGVFLSALIAISATGLDLSNLAIVAGALSVGIGFGLQAIVSNFVSGIILLIERPIKEGDWIEVGGVSGYVKRIAVRATQIDTFDRATVILPNSELISGTVINWTLRSPIGRLKVPVSVAYGTDVEKLKEILLEIARSHPMALRRPAPQVLFLGFGDSALDFELRLFLRDVNYMLSTKSDINFAIYRRLDEEGIEIPFPQRDIHLRDIDRIEAALLGRGERRGAGKAADG